MMIFEQKIKTCSKLVSGTVGNVEKVDDCLFKGHIKMRIGAQVGLVEVVGCPGQIWYTKAALKDSQR